MHQKQISDIQPGDTSTPLNVRVIRKWRPHSKNNEMCYLFVDIHGDAIEAIIDSNEENYFDNIITVHSCYTITKYLCIPSRTYMAVVPHTTSLKIGKRATFEELLHSDIPTYYFNFTSYNALKSHMNIHKLLTGTLQLESTSATTISINPPIPDINVFANKYCVNAAVADETSSTNMVFFNEAMTSILNISCADMVIIHGHTDPKIIPTPLLSLRGIPMNLHITLKKDGTISVHKANQTIGNAKTSTSLEMDAPSTTMTLTKSKKQVQHQKGAFIQKPSKKKIKR
ncbi:hypothetical protein E3N88_25076 [Mikania micrantha]|uniref:Replication protein A 70 kDa DNA-binding subunit B/D first OB fold domain-containing protein n=1 Tax=Mikania micrantha TaxID=192012 RepID=A0A5N6N6L6_9ASTR|nr:hypothetical protein E3N88_25076 [Mikania micrantha]